MLKQMQRGRGQRILAPTPAPSIGRRSSECSESATSSSSIVRRPQVGWSDSEDDEPKSQVSMGTFLKRYEVSIF